MIEFALGVICGVVLAVLSPKVYAWTSKVLARIQQRAKERD